MLTSVTAQARALRGLLWRSASAAVANASRQIPPLSAPFWLVASAYLFIVGGVYWLLYWLSYRAAVRIFPTILPHYKIDAPMFKEQLLFFGFFVIVVTGTAALPWFFKSFPVANRILKHLCRAAYAIPIVLYAVIYVLAIWRASSEVARVVMCVALAVLAVHAVARVLHRGGPGSGNGKPLSPVWEKVSLIVFCGLFFVAVGQFIAAWYPVSLPNEYYELPDRFVISRHDNQIKSLDRATVLNFLRWTDYDTCRAGGEGHCVNPYLDGPHVDVCHKSSPAQCVAPSQPRPDIKASEFDGEFWSRINDAIDASGFWQPLTGRIFQHHASAFVPAKHLLTYGLSAPIPYLYGFGYTATFSALFGIFSPSLTTYFNAYPATMLFGLVVIGLSVGYVAKSGWASFAAISMAAGILYYLGYDTMLLSAGFNPMRFVGISIQLASVFFLFRAPNSVVGVIGLIGALLFSLFWNVEFGVFGAIAQFLAVLSPQLGRSPQQRGTALSLILIAVGAVIVDRQIPLGLVRANDLMYFGVIMSYELSMYDFVAFLIIVAISTAVAFFLIRNDEPRERHARLCIAPALVIMLIKYVYMTQIVHLDATLMFVGPFLLTYLKWPRVSIGPSSKATVRRHVAVALCAAFSVMCVIEATAFRAEAATIKSRIIYPFAPDYGGALHEHLRFSVPVEPLVERVKAIKAKVRPDDAVFMLSPFDHLLAFYVNAKRYCGHFEPLNNIATTSDIQLVADCLRASPHALVIVDDALGVQCPRDASGRYEFFFGSLCKEKMKFKNDLGEVFAILKDRLVLVGRSANLKFYRMRKESSAS